MFYYIKREGFVEGIGYAKGSMALRWMARLDDDIHPVTSVSL